MATIAVNTRLLIPGKLDGMGWYAFETLTRMTVAHPEHNFVFVFDRKYSNEFIFSDNVKALTVPPQARHPLLWHIWFEYSLAYAIKTSKADMLFSPEGLLCTRTNVPQVGVVHDLNFEHFPEYLPGNVASYYKKWFKRAVEKSARLATVSQFSKDDLIKTYSVDPSKIDIVYNGVSEHFKPLNQHQIKATREEFSNGKPFFLFVGSLHPRKNILNMLLAFDEFKMQTGSDFNFLIVGKEQWWNHEMKVAFNNLKHQADIIFAGRQPDENLAKITASAFAMMYVSHFEGFGIPVIEAMKCHVPVITSNITSLPEVAGDAALLVNPKDVIEISRAMQQLVNNDQLRNSLIQKGEEQQQKFSWDKTAELTWHTIEKVLQD
jgi:glycosyltransferase involved in cell wall biosynthesis